MKEFKDHLANTLATTSQPNRWWTALKSSLFGVDSTIPALFKPDGSVTYIPQEKAELLLSAFNLKQNDKVLNLPIGCHPEPVLNSLAFRSSELKKLLLDLDQAGSVDPDGLFPLFFIKTADLLATKLGVIFRILIRKGSFPVCWRTGNVTALP